jgi:hypothetical protein
MKKSELSELLLQSIQDREMIQKVRIAYTQRIQAVERGEDTASPELLRRWEIRHDRLQIIEQYASEDIEELCDAFPIIELATQVKGVGKLTAAKLVSQIDIRRSKYISSLWKYCGYGLDEDGERDRRKKGEKLKYNNRAKAYTHMISLALIRKKSPYRPIYDDARDKYEEEHPDWTKSHHHLAALRKVKKLFLAHLWETWRGLEGLPISDPYVLEHGGHAHKHEPKDFGWPT